MHKVNKSHSLVFSLNFFKANKGINGSNYIKEKFKIKNKNKCSSLVGATSKTMIKCHN